MRCQLDARLQGAFCNLSFQHSALVELQLTLSLVNVISSIVSKHKQEMLLLESLLQIAVPQPDSLDPMFLFVQQ